LLVNYPGLLNTGRSDGDSYNLSTGLKSEWRIK